MIFETVEFQFKPPAPPGVRLRVPHITTSRVKTYIQTRLNEGAANGTINRELAALKRMLRLGYQDNKVARVPFIPMLEESNVRQGFFEHEEYLELLKTLPSHLRPVVMFAYKTGWRKSEILGLKWDRVNLKDRLVILTPEETKNKSPRTLYASDELLDLLAKQNLRRVKGCPLIFHKGGEKIGDFRKSWKKACKTAGIQGKKLFHDFRRTAVRNLTRSGTQKTVAMKITGHKTRSVFQRYNITSDVDIRRAMERQEKYLSQESVTKSVTIGHFESEKQVHNEAKIINIIK